MPTPSSPIFGIRIIFKITPTIPDVNLIIKSIYVLFAKWWWYIFLCFSEFTDWLESTDLLSTKYNTKWDDTSTVQTATLDELIKKYGTNEAAVLK